MVVYFWSRTDYGSNEHPIMIYLPHSGCNFEEALDCIMLAFHHTEIPEFIKVLMKAKINESFTDLLNEGKFSSDFKGDEDQGQIEYLFNIIKEGTEDIEKHILIRRLIKWAKDYAKKILQQLSILLSVFMSQFLSKILCNR